MGWDPVPWLIGGNAEGGAEHSPEMLRILSSLLMGGQEGVLDELSLQVLPLSTPGKGYRVTPGVAATNSRWQTRQNYIQYMESEEIKEGANSTPAARSDIVLANIKDPFSPGAPWDPPPAGPLRKKGPYIETTLITGVPITTTHFNQLNIANWTAQALARIDYGANVETVTTPMIKDLRVVVNPVTGVEHPPAPTPRDPQGGTAPKTYKGLIVGTNPGNILDNAQTAWGNWPTAANWTVPIPIWANYCDLMIKLYNVLLDNGHAWGELRAQIGTATTSARPFDFNYVSGAGGTREQIIMGGEYILPSSVRGKNTVFMAQGHTINATYLGDLWFDAGSIAEIEVTFKQKPGLAVV